MDTYNKNNMVRQWISQACIDNNQLDLNSEIRFEWSTRLKSVYAWCWPVLKKIRFSLPRWEASSIEENRDTVIHEVCHIIAGDAEHAGEWSEAMTRAGMNPKKFRGPY